MLDINPFIIFYTNFFTERKPTVSWFSLSKKVCFANKIDSSDIHSSVQKLQALFRYAAASKSKIELMTVFHFVSL